MTTDERWVGVEDVAAHLAVAKDSIYRWVENKGLPAHRVGRLLRFKISEVDEWVKQGGGDGTSESMTNLATRAKSRKGKNSG